MQKIKISQILLFSAIMLLTAVLAVVSVNLLLGGLSLGDFRGVTLVAAGVLFIYIYALALYRLFLFVVPLEEGEIAAGSRQEFAAQVNILFYLVLFNTLIRTHVLPIPLLRLVYLALGAHLGRDSYSAGAILDPPLTYVGDHCIIGHDAVLYSHAIEGKRFSLAAIRIGNGVTIGAHAVIMSGVTIDDGAIVSAGAVVTKGTRIAAGEVWGGVPAKRLRESTDARS